MHETPTNRNRELIERYFEMMKAGDPAVADLIAEEARWIAPQSSPVGRIHEGKAAVLALMAAGVGLYDPDVPLEIEQTALAADGPFVFVEMSIRARSRQGDPYHNHYVMVFRVENGAIVEVHEHLDTHYAQRLLFDPVGQPSPLESA